jgi:mannose-1-phosphate guanylyltransferase
MFKLSAHLRKRNRVVARIPTRPSTQTVALILAGGEGLRLQGLTQEIAGTPIPKQYCRLLHDRSLLEATISRTSHFAPARRTMVIVNRNHLGIAREQLPMLPEENLIVQPRNRDTGPGILFALIHLAKMYPNAVVALFPSDHYVDNDRALIKHVRRAACFVSQIPDKIAILGVAPDRPEPGYGYILPGRPLGSSGRSSGLFNVAGFSEKPAKKAAEELISEGALWNTFVMVFQLSRMMALLNKIAPERTAELLQLRQHPENASEVYRKLEPWNFSSQFLSRIVRHLLVIEVNDVSWSDWGTRESIERTYQNLQIVPEWLQSASMPSRQAG